MAQFLINYLADGAGAQNLSNVVVSAHLPVDLQRDAFAEAIKQHMGTLAGTLINAAVTSNQAAAASQAYAQLQMDSACTLSFQTCPDTQQRLVSLRSCLLWPTVTTGTRACGVVTVLLIGQKSNVNPVQCIQATLHSGSSVSQSLQACECSPPCCKRLSVCMPHHVTHRA